MEPKNRQFGNIWAKNRQFGDIEGMNRRFGKSNLGQIGNFGGKYPQNLDYTFTVYRLITDAPSSGYIIKMFITLREHRFILFEHFFYAKIM